MALGMWSRRRLAGIAFGVVALAVTAGAALAAIAPWYPRDEADTCKVKTGAVPLVETPPPH